MSLPVGLRLLSGTHEVRVQGLYLMPVVTKKNYML